ncbi:hypothetical protein AVEN_102653-1 [Araneus ventricosus]|uniref:Uncharacterized protein n=1 Tax=Araneus ventricosus TaxID=182803 RepID=A0A4Y2HZF2_ARAVE|nr:hypothetical protein AVEN_102653-1 [Araneus ventricosus]
MQANDHHLWIKGYKNLPVGTELTEDRSGASVPATGRARLPPTVRARLAVQGNSVMKLISNFRQIFIYQLNTPLRERGAKSFYEGGGNSLLDSGVLSPPLALPLIEVDKGMSIKIAMYLYYHPLHHHFPFRLGFRTEIADEKG